MMAESTEEENLECFVSKLELYLRKFTNKKTWKFSKYFV